MVSLEVDGGFLRVEGTEASVVRLIAMRQQMGKKKYGVTVRENDLPLKAWLQHSLEETLDNAIYLMRAIEQLDKEGDDLK